MLVHLAAYGTLMTGETNRLSPAVRRRMLSLGSCRIPGRLFRVSSPSGFVYPALVAAPGQSVPGELFTLPAADLATIDAYEDFRPQTPRASTYIRRRLIVQSRSGSVRAWVYIWNRTIIGLKPIPGNALPRASINAPVSPDRC